MLSQPYPKLDHLNFSSSHQDDLTRTTRLSDIKKGADFTKAVNELAEQQWRTSSVIPRIVETEDQKVTPNSSRKDFAQYTFDEPQLLQTSTPLRPIPPTRATPLNIMVPATAPNFNTVPPNRAMPLNPIPRDHDADRSSIGSVSREIRNIPPSRSSLFSSIYASHNNENIQTAKKNHRNLHHHNPNNGLIVRRSQYLPNIEELRDPKFSVDLEELYFNTWGSRELGMESKLVPEQIPKVVAPKRSVPSSRIATQTRDRHIRTETDFRSRNGVVRIVKPLKPLPSIAQFQYPSTENIEDPGSIGREKTYVTLKRIDQILHPQKAYITGELNSSEIEILGSGSTTPVSVKRKISETRKLEDARKLSHGSYVNHYGVNVLNTFPNRYNQPYSCQTTAHKISKSLSPVLKTLESEKITSYEKCLKWVDKCSEWY